jgi:hypothetical protein
LRPLSSFFSFLVFFFSFLISVPALDLSAEAVWLAEEDAAATFDLVSVDLDLGAEPKI